MFHGDVVDQLLDDNSLADTRAAKCADFAAFCKWANKIDDLDPSFQDLCRCVLLCERRRRPMDWVTLGVVHRCRGYQSRSPVTLKSRPSTALAYWHGDWTASVGHAHSALQALLSKTSRWSAPSFRPDAVALRASTSLGCHSLRTQFRGRCRFSAASFVRKFHVHYGTDYLNYVSFIHKSSLTTECHLRCGDLE